MSAPTGEAILTSVGGATLMVLPDPSFGLARFVVAFRRGAAYEPAGSEGALSACLELLLRGTVDKDRQRFAAALERLGSDLEPSCGHEAAMLRGMCLSRHLAATWELLVEAVATPRLCPDEFARLREEICDGLLAERDEDDAVAELFLRRALFAGHPLGRQPGGEVAHVQALDLAAVQAAHRRLAADDLLIAFAGDVDPGAATRMAEALVAVLPAHAPASAAVAPPPAPTHSRVVIVDKPARTQVQLRLAGLGPTGTHPDVEAFWLGITAFGGTFTSPLTREVRDIRGWSYTAHADFRRRARLASPVVLRSAPAVADAPACLELEASLWAQLCAGDVAPATCDAAQQYVLNRLPFEVATAFDRLAARVAHALLGLPPELLDGAPARLAALAPPAVQAALRTHLAPGHFVALLVAPAAAVRPAIERLRWAAPGPVTVQTLDYRLGLSPA